MGAQVTATPGVSAATLSLYGRDLGRAVAAVNYVRDLANKASPVDDPAGTLGYVVDAGRQLADLLGVDGVDMSGAASAAGIMGAVINGYVKLLTGAMARKGEEEEKARAAAQVAVLHAAQDNGLAAGHGLWELVVDQKEVGDAAFFTNYRNVGLPGVLSKAREAIFPTDPGAGCYHVTPVSKNGGKQAHGAGPWRIYPALFPWCFNTNTLGPGTALSREAAIIMGNLAAVGVDPGENLSQDARVVAKSFARFWAWSRPMREGQPGMGARDPNPASPTYGKRFGEMTPVYPSGATRRRVTPADRHEAGERNFYFEPGELTILAYGHNPETDGPAIRTWYDLDNGAAVLRGSCYVDAYNYVVTSFARFFAVREALLRRRAGWDKGMRELAAASPDADLRAALKRPAPPLPRGRNTTSTTTLPKPTAKPRKPVRVGRAAPARVGRRDGELAAVLAADDMPTLARQLAAWSSRR